MITRSRIVSDSTESEKGQDNSNNNCRWATESSGDGWPECLCSAACTTLR